MLSTATDGTLHDGPVRSLPKRIFSYWIVPIIGSCVWVGMLIAMLVVWAAEHKPHWYWESEHQKIPYISDIGASGIKPLFIVGSCITSVCFFITLSAERWLRHKGRLIANVKSYEKILSGLAILGALVGSVGLILLSIFDTRRHHRLHDVFLGVFMIGVIISAVATVIEYNRLMRKHMNITGLKISYWAKLVFLVVEVSLAIAFVVEDSRGSNNPAAVLEWAIAFIFTGYLMIFWYDLYPATRTHAGDLKDVELQLAGDRAGLYRTRSAIHGTATDY